MYLDMMYERYLVFELCLRGCIVVNKKDLTFAHSHYNFNQQYCFLSLLRFHFHSRQQSNSGAD